MEDDGAVVDQKVDMKQIRHSTTHPRFLHSNSTSHKWAFGAIAELVDNALDAGATLFEVDMFPFPKPNMLLLQDNGHGMAPLDVHRMLSFGHCNKEDVEGVKEFIGYYGNGFKSGSMRLGKDALVFSKDKQYKTVGFLSQTFLAAVNAEEVLTPIVSWRLSDSTPVDDFSLSYDATGHHLHNLEVILKYSPYATEEELMEQFEYIEDTGTRIIIFNLAQLRSEDGSLHQELIPMDIHNKKDIILPDYFPLDEQAATEDRAATARAEEDAAEAEAEKEPSVEVVPVEDKFTKQLKKRSDSPPELYSLRAYLAILYYLPRMQIKIRGVKVRTRRIITALHRPAQYWYSPKSAAPILFTFGFNKISKEYFGTMWYNKGRLIRMYVRLGIQLNPDSRGTGVIGVVNQNILQPAHNKQEFISDDNYRLLSFAFKDRLAKYWQEHAPVNGTLGHFWKKELPKASKEGPFWIQCNNLECLKWRKVSRDDLPDHWVCSMNDDEEYANCAAEEEPVDVESLTPSSTKKKMPTVEELEQELEQQSRLYEQRLAKKKLSLRRAKARELAKKHHYKVNDIIKSLELHDDNEELAIQFLDDGNDVNDDEVVHSYSKRTSKPPERFAFSPTTTTSPKKKKKRKHKSASSDSEQEVVPSKKVRTRRSHNHIDLSDEANTDNDADSGGEVGIPGNMRSQEVCQQCILWKQHLLQLQQTLLGGSHTELSSAYDFDVESFTEEISSKLKEQLKSEFNKQQEQLLAKYKHKISKLRQRLKSKEEAIKLLQEKAAKEEIEPTPVMVPPALSVEYDFI